jgi:hypothetical protein
MRRLPCLLVLVALPALAETPMTPEAFDAYATGKTLSYALSGTVFGTEVYRPGRKVTWAFTAEECREGYWYARGSEVCFVYEDPNDPQCWLFFQRANGLWAQYTGDGPDAPMSEVTPAQGPLSCMGPAIGS